MRSLIYVSFGANLTWYDLNQPLLFCYISTVDSCLLYTIRSTVGLSSIDLNRYFALTCIISMLQYIQLCAFLSSNRERLTHQSHWNCPKTWTSRLVIWMCTHKLVILLKKRFWSKLCNNRVEWSILGSKEKERYALIFHCIYNLSLYTCITLVPLLQYISLSLLCLI